MKIPTAIIVKFVVRSCEGRGFESHVLPLGPICVWFPWGFTHTLKGIIAGRGPMPTIPPFPPK